MTVDGARDMAELRDLLGGRRLDGTLSSLFAVDRIVEALAALGIGGEAAARLVPWLAPYLERIVRRAWSELGLTVHPERLALAAPPYAIDTSDVLRRLIDASGPFPFDRQASVLADDPRVGPARTAWWGLGAILRVHPWAEPGAAPIATEASVAHARPWLARQHAWLVAGDRPDLAPWAIRLAEAMAYPAVGHPADPHGVVAVARAVGSVASAPDPRPARHLLLRYAAGPDAFLATAAARACVALGMVPTAADEAAGFARALEPGSVEHLPAHVRDAIRALAPRARENDAAIAARLLAWAKKRAPATSGPAPHPPRAGAAEPPADPAARRAAIDRAISEHEKDKARLRAEASVLEDQAQLAEQVGREKAAVELRARAGALARKADEAHARVEALRRERDGLAPDPAAPAGAALAPGDAKVLEALAAALRSPSPREAPAAAGGASPAPAGGALAALERALRGGDAAPAAARRGALPEKLGDYDVLGILGVGGMGKVYRVHHPRWDLELAMKVPVGEVDARVRASIAEEVDAWAGLGLHPHVTTCYFAEIHDGVPWILAELVDGGSLADWIRKDRLHEAGGGSSGRTPLAALLDVAWQTAAGLAHAHERGVIHQDVKPANVLMTPDGRAKVTDFGLARAGVRGERPAGGATLIAGFRGMTPAYCSPEQARASQRSGSRTLTRRTDVWSWAAMMLETFTGAITWGLGPSAGDGLRAFRESGLEAPGKTPMPAALADLLARCLAEREEDRPASMTEVAVAVAAIERDVLGREPRVEEPPPHDGADELYNRGLGLWSVGEQERALALWHEARRTNPLHAEAALALALARWRRGDISDVEATQRFADLRQMVSLRARSGGAARAAAAHVDELRAGIHAERGAAGVARSLLEAAAAARGGTPSPPARRLMEVLRGPIAVARALRCAPSAAGIALSADGAVAVGVGAPDDKGPSVARFEVATGKSRKLRWEHGVDALAADAAAAAVATITNGTVERVVLESGETRVLGAPDRAGPPTAVAMAPGGGFVAAARGSLATVHDLTARTYAVIEDLGGDVRCVALSAKDGLALLAVAGTDVIVETDGTKRTFRTMAPGPVDHVACSASGDRRFAAGRQRNDERGWLAAWADGIAPIWQRALPEPPRCMAISADGRVGVTIGASGLVQRWDLTCGRCVVTMDGLWRGAHAVALSADGRRLAVVRADGWTGVHDVELDLPAFRLAPVRPTSSEDVAARTRELAARAGRVERAIADGRVTDAVMLLAELRSDPRTARAARTRSLWTELARRTRRGAISAAWPVAEIEPGPGPVRSVELTPDGAALVIAYDGRTTIEVRDAWSGARRAILDHDGVVRGVAVALRGELWAALVDRCVVVHRTDEARTAAAGAPLACALELDAERIAVSGDGRWLVAHDAARLAVLEREGEHLRVARTIALAGWDVARVALGHDGADVVIASARGVHRVDLRAASELPAPLLDGHAALDVVRSPFTDDVVVGLASGAVARVAAGSAPTTSPDVEDAGETPVPVTGVAVSYDGRVAVTVDRAGVAAVWSLPERSRVVTLMSHGDVATDVAITPCGRFAATGGRDGRVRVWALEWELVPTEPRDTLDPAGVDVVRRARARGADAAEIRRELSWAGHGDATDAAIARA